MPMRVIFYSAKCQFCQKLLIYIDKNNISKYFKLINIDTTSVPKQITVVPTIVDEELNEPMEGKKAFEYLLNLKFFNNPTNNVEIVKLLPPNPDIPEDTKAIKSFAPVLDLSTNDPRNENKMGELFTNNESAKFYEERKNQEVKKIAKEMSQARQIQEKELTLLIKMRQQKY
jgi:hypothetical protein